MTPEHKQVAFIASAGQGFPEGFVKMETAMKGKDLGKGSAILFLLYYE